MKLLVPAVPPTMGEDVPIPSQSKYLKIVKLLPPTDAFHQEEDTVGVVGNDASGPHF